MSLKKFFIYTLLFITPFIIILSAMELMLRRVPNTYMAKANYLEKNSNDIQIIILGSSHGITGINPECFSKNTFNLANYAQTLDFDYALLNKYQDQLNSLEYIVVPLSYHLLWTKLKYHNQTWRPKYYDIYYGLNSERNPLKRLLFPDQTMRTNINILWNYYYKKENPIADFTPFGFNALTPAKDLNTITRNSEKIASAHKAKDLIFLFEENVEYIKQIIEIAKNKNAKVIFVTIPAHPSFVKLLDKKQLDMLYSTASELENGKDVFYYNFLYDFSEADPRETVNLFFDVDHLSSKGATIVGHKLDSIIKIIEFVK